MWGWPLPSQFSARFHNPALLFNNHLQMHSNLHSPDDRDSSFEAYTFTLKWVSWCFHASFHNSSCQCFSSSTSPGKTKVGVQLWSPQRIKSDFNIWQTWIFSHGGGGMLAASKHQVTFKFGDCYYILGWILNLIFLLSCHWILVGEIPGYLLTHTQRYSIHGVRICLLIFETCARDINGYHLSNHIS